ncbi:MAG: HlyD family efflux transporter periplasmic adaptor subunit [Planctomycetes bacterium]|nr:HlyD family efflux transporter periplasmic adaptor subunit [Planctomycetota bacterium]
MDGRQNIGMKQNRSYGWIVRVAVIIVALGGVAAVAAIGLSRGINGDGGGGAGKTVDQYQVQITSFDLIIPASGELESKEKIEIRNKVEGRTTIKWVIDEGTTVKEGDLLVELVSEDLENRIRDEEMRVRERQSRYTAAVTALDLQKSQNESALQKADTQRTLAQLELDKWLSGDDVTKEKELDLAIEKAERNQRRYEEDYQESIRLEEQGFISTSQLTDDYIRMIEANAELDKANRAKDIYHTYTRIKEETSRKTDLQQATDELARVIKQNEAQLIAKQDAVSSEQDQLTQMQERLKGWVEQLDACTVYAPSDGLVVYGTTGNSHRPWRMEDPLMIGREVYSNQLLITLPDIVRMKAAVKVHESQANQVKPGMPARVKVDAMPDLSLMGHVTSVGVMAQQSFGSQVREYSVDIEIDPDNTWDLKPSMRCKADILLGHVDDVKAIPLTGVFADRGRHYVWKRVSRGRFERVNVQTGRASETMIEIQDGLENKDVVLLREPLPGEVVGSDGDQADADGGPDMGEGGQPQWPQGGGQGGGELQKTQQPAQTPPGGGQGGGGMPGMRRRGGGGQGQQGGSGGPSVGSGGGGTMPGQHSGGGTKPDGAEGGKTPESDGSSESTTPPAGEQEPEQSSPPAKKTNDEG